MKCFQQRKQERVCYNLLSIDCVWGWFWKARYFACCSLALEAGPSRAFWELIVCWIRFFTFTIPTFLMNCRSFLFLAWPHDMYYHHHYHLLRASLGLINQSINLPSSFRILQRKHFLLRLLQTKLNLPRKTYHFSLLTLTPRQTFYSTLAQYPSQQHLFSIFFLSIHSTYLVPPTSLPALPASAPISCDSGPQLVLSYPRLVLTSFHLPPSTFHRQLPHHHSPSFPRHLYPLGIHYASNVVTC